MSQHHTPSCLAKKSRPLAPLSAYALGVGVVLATCAMLSPGSSSAAMSASAANSTEVNAQSQLRRLGISPTAAAAIGIELSTLQAIITTSKAWTQSQQQAIAAADDHLANAIAELRSAEVSVSRSPNAQTRAELASARQAHHQARTDRAILDDALRSAITASLTASQNSRFIALRENATVDVPVPYRLVTRPAEEWTKIRDSLAERVTSERDGQSLNTATSDYLALIESDAETSAALSRLANSGAALEQLWQTEFAS